MGLSTKHLTKEQKELLNFLDKQYKKAIAIFKQIKDSEVDIEKIKQIHGW